jgi:membrane protein DedA with SNARE-associated domain
VAWMCGGAPAAATLGSSLGFALGHYGGRPLLARYQSTFRIHSRTLDRGEDLFARFGAASIFLARFVFGLRVIAGPLAGVLRMPWRRFLVWNFLGAAVWVAVVSWAGYLFGRHWGRVERMVGRFDLGVVILLVLAAGVWWWRSRPRNEGVAA